MAVSVGRTIQELKETAKTLGIIVPEREDGKRLKKEDYIYPIRKYYLKKYYGDNIPNSLNLMLQIKSPMLAGRIDKFKPEQQKEVWDSDKWDMEMKLNGVRCFIISDSDGIHLYSRHNSDVDLLPISFSNKVLFPTSCDLSKIKKSFILDCEMTSDASNICTILDGIGVETGSQLQAVTAILGSLPERALEIQRKNNLFFVFNSFDCIYYDGSWIINEPLTKRREVAEEIISSLEKCGFNIRRVPHTNVNKKEFFRNLVNRDFEGTVAKRLDGIYIPDTTRNFKGWVKCKKSASYLLSEQEMEDAFNTELSGSGIEGLEDITFGDTIDAFITGFEPGNKGTAFEKLIGSVAVSVYVQRKDGTTYVKEIGRFSGILLSLRHQMTEIIDGQPTLKPEYYGRVCEVDGMGLSARNMKLNHCQFLGFRLDKSSDACVMTEEQLEKLVNM